MSRRKAKPRRQPPTSQVCTSCEANAVIVTGTHPRICVECFNWPPDPKARTARPKTKRKDKRHGRT